MYQEITYDVQDPVAIITMNRPEALNALTGRMMAEIRHALGAAENDPAVVGIVLTGAGRGFCAGADISGLDATASGDSAPAEDLSELAASPGNKEMGGNFQVTYTYILSVQKPVIAAINGFALGGGLELAMSCHFRIASDNAKMGLPEVSLGLIPGYGGTQRLPQLVGKGKAMEMIMTAGMIDANQALSYGLVNHVVPQEELLPLCYEIASKIKRNSSVAVGKAIKAVNANYKDGKNGFKVEIKQFGKCFGTEDFEEGTTAFLEKRKANFPGK